MDGVAERRYLMGSLRDEVVAEFMRLEEDLLHTEKAHFAASEHFKALHYLLGGVAAVASAATAASALDERSALASVLALVATVAAALVTFVKPEATATRHVAAARQLGDLRFRIRQARLLDAHEGSSVTERDLRDLATAFTAEKQTLLADAPTTSSLSFRRGRRKIKKGDFNYQAGDGLTGTGSGA